MNNRFDDCYRILRSIQKNHLQASVRISFVDGVPQGFSVLFGKVRPGAEIVCLDVENLRAFYNKPDYFG